MDFNQIKNKATEAYNKLDPEKKEELKKKGKEAVDTVKDKITKK
ncbi:MAG: hypothetical protein WAN89_01170 [Lawsonella sp.]